MHRSLPRYGEEVFILPAMLCLLGTLVWASLDSRVWSGHFYRFPLMGLTHVFTLGWLSLMIQGVLRRLAPILLSESPRGRRWAFTTAGLWVVGGSGMVAHMMRGEWFGVWTAAVCLWVTALLLPFEHPGIVRRARKGEMVACYATLAFFHLILAASLGLLIGLNKHLEWFAVNPLSWMGAHFHLAGVGWVTFMILGFGRKLLPITAPRTPRESWMRLAGLESGLVLTIAGLLSGTVLLKLGAFLLAAFVILHVWRPIVNLLAGRIRDRGSFWASMALGFLALDAVLGLVLAWFGEGRLHAARDRLLFTYGVVAFLGWNTLVITSLALKLFPLWVWQERFGPDWSIRPVPAVQDLYRPWLREVTGAALTLGTLLIAAGLLVGLAELSLWGARVALLGALCFVSNVVLLARWAFIKFEPGTKDWERFHALSRSDVSSPPPGGVKP